MGLLPQFSVELSKGSSLSLRGNASRRSANSDGNSDDDFEKALERAGTSKNADPSAQSQQTPARDPRTADEPNSSGSALKKQQDKSQQDDAQAADDSSSDPTSTTAVTAGQPAAASNDSAATTDSTGVEGKKSAATNEKDARKPDDAAGTNGCATAAASAVASSSVLAQTAAAVAAKTVAATAGEVAATVLPRVDVSRATKTQARAVPGKAAGAKAATDDNAQNTGDADANAEAADAKLKPAVSRLPELKGNVGNGHGSRENGHQQQTAAEVTQEATSTISPADLARQILNTDSDATAAAQPSTGQPTAVASDKDTATVNVQATSIATNANKQADSSSASSASSAQDSPSPDSQQTFDQVVLGLKGKFDARTGKAEIRLDPPNLGAVRVSVTLENGSLTAEFQSPSDVVRSLLNDNLDKLKTVLESQGVAVDKLAVNQPVESAATQQGGTQSGNFGSATHDGRSAGHYQQDPRSPRRSDADGFARVLKKTTAPLDLVA